MSVSFLRFVVVYIRFVWIAIVHATHTLHPPIHADPRIVNGVPTTYDEYPFLAGIRMFLYDSDGTASWSDTFCGASLIRKEYPAAFLTASHCLFEVTDDLVLHIYTTHRLEYPVYDLNGWYISHVILHENFDPETLDHDVAIVFIDADLTQYTDISVVSLPNLPIGIECCTVDEVLEIIGYGRVAWDGDFSETLQYLDVEYLSRTQCNQQFCRFETGKSASCPWSYVNGNNICAASSDALSTPCFGDSGGPLMKKGSLLQVGVVSWGIGCYEHLPTVYTSTATYYSWIDTQLNTHVGTDIEWPIYPWSPTSAPTLKPTASPTWTPTKSPTNVPTTATNIPTRASIVPPTFVPTKLPTSPSPFEGPTLSPTLHASHPTSQPVTSDPTPSPTPAPVFPPTDFPTIIPTDTPTVSTSTSSPTENLVNAPTHAPVRIITRTPTLKPTTMTMTTEAATTLTPTFSPVSDSSFPPSGTPTLLPSLIPSKTPTSYPSASSMTTQTPTFLPSSFPTFVPTNTPSFTFSSPSSSPSVFPSAHPTFSSSLTTSQTFVELPSKQNTGSVPTAFPTVLLTNEPSLQPIATLRLPTTTPTLLSDDSEEGFVGTIESSMMTLPLDLQDDSGAQPLNAFEIALIVAFSSLAVLLLTFFLLFRYREKCPFSNSHATYDSIKSPAPSNGRKPDMDTEDEVGDDFDIEEQEMLDPMQRIPTDTKDTIVSKGE